MTGVAALTTRLNALVAVAPAASATSIVNCRTAFPSADTVTVRTGAPFFYEQQGERFGFGPPAFQQEMLAKLARGERLW